MTHEKLLQVIGKNIKEARNEKEMKGETLAKTLEVDKSYISHMEHGLVDFRISLLQHIAEILNIDVCKLISLKIIKSAEELKDIPSQQEAILIHRMVIDQLLTQMEERNKEPYNK